MKYNPTSPVFRVRPRSPLPPGKDHQPVGSAPRRLIAVGFRPTDNPPRPVVFWELDGHSRYRMRRITRIRRDWFDDWRNHCFEVEADGRVYYLAHHRSLLTSRYGRSYWILIDAKAPPSI
ncbi:MAG: hypothetical protein IMX00_01595 [Limnochordales bacterium]|nr:hypothetical protein [Limnochordales bacterium]